MTYTHAINLRYVRIDNFATWAIALRETGGRKKYTHVGAITDPDASGVRFEYGARHRVDGALSDKPGVQYRPLDYATFKYQALVSIPVTEHEHYLFWGALKAVEGWPYSDRTILGFVTGHNFDDRHGFICDAVDLWGLRHAGMLPKELHGDIRMMDPMDSFYLALGIRDNRKVGT